LNNQDLFLFLLFTYINYLTSLKLKYLNVNYSIIFYFNLWI